MVEGVETHQSGPFGVIDTFADGCVANAHVHLDHAFRRRTQQSTDSRRDRPAAGDHQHIAFTLAAHMGQRIADALDKIFESRHTCGLRAPVHPLLQTFAQQSEMVFVQLWRVGFGQWRRVDAVDHRLAVVFIQSRPDQRLQAVVLQS